MVTRYAVLRIDFRKPLDNMIKSLKIRQILSFLVPGFALVLAFTVLQCKKEEEKIMKVKNNSISEILSSSAKADATIIDIGDGIDQHGHCWSSSAEPTIYTNDGITVFGERNTLGSYSSLLTGLSPSTKYNVRAYLKKGTTVVYGADILSFTTLSISIPVVATGTITDTTTSGATVTGELISLGSGVSEVSQHGHCWSSETTTPIIEGNENKTSLGTRDATGNFESTIVGLTEGTLYYVRAYATNDAGTAYGDAASFTTKQSATYPSVSTANVSSITATSAVCGGSISSDGGSPITAKGVCWNTAFNPTTSDYYTDDGTGSASFASEITGLTENTVYYVRAYATNSEGTAYGNQESFTTLEEIDLPTVTTAAVGQITTTTAMSGGDVTSEGDSPVTAKGVCWNKTGSPTASENHTEEGPGTGVFISFLSGLDHNTEYYVRAYATNSGGTAYGNQLIFTTLYDPCEGVTSFVYEGLEYSVIAIGSQCWMAENINVGSRIDVSQDQTDNSSIEKYCYDNLESSCEIYGGIYQWDELMQYSPSDSGIIGTTQGICPSGWHIPTDEEWKTLEAELGMDSSELDSAGMWRGTDEGGKLKQEGTSYWSYPNEGATNETGFTALPSGGMVDRVFGGIGDFTDFWTATEYKLNTDGAWYRLLDADHGGIFRTAGYKPNGTVVRCIKD